MIATLENISTSKGLFTAGIFGWLVIVICDIVVARAFSINGYTALLSKAIPEPISFLLLIAAASYIVIHLFYSFLPQLDPFTAPIEAILAIP